MNQQTGTWWGTFTIEEEQPHFWEIGPLLLCVKKSLQELHIASKSFDDIDKSDIKIALKETSSVAKESLQFKRFVFQETSSLITLTPMVADRPQVSHAETPFYLPANEQITIYVSSPVWVRVEAGDSKSLLDEIPTIRLSDTWFGPNTREGELCYANSTFCRTHLKDLPIRPHRIISPVIVCNHSKHPQLLEQLSLPLPFLSVYADKDGGLWTEEIIVKNEAHHKHIIKQGKGAPSIAPTATLVSPARCALKSHHFINLFYSLLTD